MNIITKYFNWLQKDNPVGVFEHYPEINEKKETSLSGVYIVGDLTRIPLLKLANNGGAQIIEQLFPEANPIPKNNNGENVYDLAIVGAGPAGIAAAVECKKRGIRYIVLESSRIFNTIENFPKGKPIVLKPEETENVSALKMHEGTKETLLEELKTQIEKQKLLVEVGTMVQKIERNNNILHIETNNGVYKANSVVLAMGKSGNSRELKVPGESSSKVFNKLFDPAEFKNKEILVIGGGDSAMESSIALAQSGNRITHSYRKDQFSRPKEDNLIKFNDLLREGRINVMFESTVKEIRENDVIIKTKTGEETIDNDAVFTLIGRELPTPFFNRSNIRMEGEKSALWWCFLITSISFFSLLYFGKSGIAFNAFSGYDTVLQKIAAYITAPFHAPLNWTLSGYKWYSSLNFIFGWLSSIVFLASGLTSLFFLIRGMRVYFGTPWNAIKYLYFIGVSVFFTWLYFSNSLNYKSGMAEWIESPTYWYSFFYCVTMFIFSLRRAFVKKTRYITLQMTSLVLIQILFLFLLPFYLYEPLIHQNLGPDHWIIKELFPSGKWSSFAFILLWPLNLWEFGNSTFWTWFPFVQSGFILFFLIRHYGKGVYCGWICSCGGMAESLGDEYRRKAPHGPKAKRLENIGQWILIFAVVTSAMIFLGKSGIWNWKSNSMVTYVFAGVYKFSIDVIFAGILGLGVYFFLGGRIWCRYGCPLAALMHIYARFTRYRIVAEKKNCISCELCSRICHMGIDVMAFASKGIPMNDVECVRCSACVIECPMEVLAFAKLEHGDINNYSRDQVPSYGKDDWRAGLK